MTRDRRVHRMFVTRNTEYHLRIDECVGVRDRTSGAWVANHAALRLRAISVPPMGGEGHMVGQRIHFWSHSVDVLTSPVTAVARPERTCVGAYVSHAQAGLIAA